MHIRLVLGSLPPEISAALVASVLTGLLTAGGIVATRLVLDRCIDADQLRLAISAEIRAVLQLLRADNFADFLDLQIKSMESGVQEALFMVSFRSNYNTVFVACASKLALLQRFGSSRRVVEELVTYYYLLQSVIELSEIIIGMDREMKSKGNFPASMTPEASDRLALLRRLKIATSETVRMGCDLVNYLEINR